MGSRLTLAQKLKSTMVVTTCSIGTFVGIGIYKNNEVFYDQCVMPVVQLLSPELCHRSAVLGFKYNLFPKQKQPDSQRLTVKFFDHILSNPIGIAAGFDKHGEAINGLHNIGFGFIEIGSVTPEPQPGNQRPRVFRLIEDKAIINRYGFNSEGHAEVYERLIKLKASKENEHIVLGVNLGKNKSTEHASGDYAKGIAKFSSVADYFVVNVSSPNTPGLRDLQHKNDLQLLLKDVVAARNSHCERTLVLLKIAPDLSDSDVRDIVSVISKRECRVDGVIIANTTIARDPNLRSNDRMEIGGLSGAPLTRKSTEMIAKFYLLTKGQVPIVGVGGIFSGQDAYDKIVAGSTVVQLYTSMIFHGPPVLQKVKRELDELLAADGFENVESARGTKAKEWAKYNPHQQVYNTTESGDL